jgi:hypothetical protein
MHLRPIDSEHPNPSQAGISAQRQNLAEQAGDRVLMTLAKPCDRRVIRRLVSRDHPERNVLDALALNHPRRALAAAIRVEPQRDHHLRAHVPAGQHHPRYTAGKTRTDPSP